MSRLCEDYFFTSPFFNEWAKLTSADIPRLPLRWLAALCIRFNGEGPADDRVKPVTMEDMSRQHLDDVLSINIIVTGALLVWDPGRVVRS